MSYHYTNYMDCVYSGTSYIDIDALKTVSESESDTANQYNTHTQSQQRSGTNNNDNKISKVEIATTQLQNLE